MPDGHGQQSGPTPPVALRYVPRPHSEHDVAPSAVPYVPAGHASHAAAGVLPPDFTPNVPAAHAAHSVLPADSL